MESKELQKPIVAIMYDFDKTLSPKDMQEYSFIPRLGMEPSEFWTEVDKLAADNKMDPVLAYMYEMIRKSSDLHIGIRKADFENLGESIELFPGVEQWFGLINAIGEEYGVQVEHYVISSGLKEILKGCSIYDEFKEVYACEFLYNENDLAVWPKMAVNYTGKTQYLFRINKGVLDVSYDKELNRYVPDDQRRVPFRNMIYIGDGLTDVPCMKLVKVNGGQSIAVYNPENRKSIVDDLLKDKRVDFALPADYTEGSPLFETVRTIINKMALMSKLSEAHHAQMNELDR